MTPPSLRIGTGNVDELRLLFRRQMKELFSLVLSEKVSMYSEGSGLRHTCPLKDASNHLIWDRVVDDLDETMIDQ